MPCNLKTKKAIQISLMNMKVKQLILFFLILINFHNSYSQVPLIIHAIKKKKKERKENNVSSQSEFKKNEEAKNSEYYFLLAKKDLEANSSFHTYSTALGNLDKSLLLNINNDRAKELQSNTNYAFGMYALENGKSELKNNLWADGYYFYVALEHFSNAYQNGLNKKQIVNYIQEIDLIAKKEGKEFKEFNESNLYKISTAYQEKNTISYDSIKSVYLEKKRSQDINKEDMLNVYKKMDHYGEFYFIYNKFQSYDYERIKKEKAVLEAEIGN